VTKVTYRRELAITALCAAWVLLVFVAAYGIPLLFP
jgi:hypothetical protein